MVAAENLRIIRRKLVVVDDKYSCLVMFLALAAHKHDPCSMHDYISRHRRSTTATTWACNVIMSVVLNISAEGEVDSMSTD